MAVDLRPRNQVNLAKKSNTLIYSPISQTPLRQIQSLVFRIVTNMVMNLYELYKMAFQLENATTSPAKQLHVILEQNVRRENITYAISTQLPIN
jgi:hypothetical protein